jgi:hypothetical protein
MAETSSPETIRAYRQADHEQVAALWTQNGYRLVKTEVAETMSVRTVGGGLKRSHFEKPLAGTPALTGEN